MAQPKSPPAHHSFVLWLWDWIKSITVALLVWLVLRTFLVQAFRIPSGSMENTLLLGDFFFVNKALYGAEIPLVHKRLPAFREPERNDILVFDSVEEPIDVVKRMVGMPGDTLAMEGGQLIRNGERLDEPYVVHASPLPIAAPEQPIYGSSVEGWCKLGQALSELGRRDEARAALQEALASYRTAPWYRRADHRPWKRRAARLLRALR